MASDSSAVALERALAEKVPHNSSLILDRVKKSVVRDLLPHRASELSLGCE
jgi:hypothetical protein